MTADGKIDYEALAQNAMRGVVRAVLEQTGTTGLPGDHHFYISFDTLAPGVVLSKRLREKYPGEMTIVLQHRFWDLVVSEDRFEVKLTFDGIPERLVIPYQSIKVFFDPSVRYGLQFEPIEVDADGADRPSPPAASDAGLHPVQAPREEFADTSAEKDASPDGNKRQPVAEDIVPLVSLGLGQTPNGDGTASANEDEIEDEDEPGAEIVSLDAFRKK